MGKVVHFRDNKCLIGCCDDLSDVGPGWQRVSTELWKESGCEFKSIVTVEFRENENVCAFLEFENSFYCVAHVVGTSFTLLYKGGEIEKAYQLFAELVYKEIRKK